MLLTLCPNGDRATDAHPALSSDPETLAADSAAAVAAGAAEVHLHPKDAGGRDSLRAEDLSRWLRAFWSICPQVPLGVTTGAWATGGAQERLSQVRRWRELPDLASLNWHEEGAEDLAALLIEREVGIEAGLWGVEAAQAWVRSPHAAACHRVLIELPDLPAEQVRDLAEEILTVIDGSGHGLPVLLHGEERSAWPGVLLARELGLDTRIGLEDTLTLPDGTDAASNTELVLQCRALLRL